MKSREDQNSDAGLGARFMQEYERTPSTIAAAPGRVNLIGEHTDYNDGFVLPIAIQQRTRVAAAARADDLLRVHSLTIGEAQQWPIGHWKKNAQPHWTSYVAGVAELLRARGAHLNGADLLIESGVPEGGGLSSSAALEVATALALAELSGEPLESRELVDLCRQAEVQFAGTPCGIMDQTASLLGQADCALLVDCRSREVRPIPIPFREQVFITIDTGVRHDLGDGRYARLTEQCAAAVAYFRRLNPEVRALRDVSMQTLRAHLSQMDPLDAARAMHVLSENERTLKAAEHLAAGRVREFGALMYESHRSLREDYEVSCAELDQLVDILGSVPGVHGARMTGGGFGGCVVALLDRAALDPVRSRVESEYRVAGPRAGQIVLCQPSSGAALESA